MLKLLEGSTYATRQGRLRVQDILLTKMCASSSRCFKRHYIICKRKSWARAKCSNRQSNSYKEKADIISGGNFDEPMAVVFDFLGIGAAEIANISEEDWKTYQSSTKWPSSFLNKRRRLKLRIYDYSVCSSGFSIRKQNTYSFISRFYTFICKQEDIVSMGTT